MTLGQFAGVHLRSRGQRVPDNDADTFRAAMSTVTGLDDLVGVIHASVLDGYRRSPDTLAGVYTVQPLPNYLLAELGTLTVQPTLDRIIRGAAAPHATFSLSSTGYRLMKFGVQFVIDEQDLDDAKPISIYQLALAEIGASVRRLMSDLLWSLVLENPTLGDGTALFAAARGNYATGGASALGQASLDTALAASAGQTGEDEHENPVHLGASAKYFFVPPVMNGAAKRRLRTLWYGIDDLIVVTESRLSAAGVVDPRTETVRTGSSTNWMLAAPAAQAPSIILGLLNGQAEPTVRSFTLDKGGEWGIGFDVSFSCGVAAVDGKPLYWSDGA